MTNSDIQLPRLPVAVGGHHWSMTRAVQVVIRGRVQGVGFRYSTLQRASGLGLGGWVRNRPDGSVEAWLEGPEPAVAALVDWLAIGPSHAQVVGVQTSARQPAGFTDFRLR